VRDTGASGYGANDIWCGVSLSGDHSVETALTAPKTRMDRTKVRPSLLHDGFTVYDAATESLRLRSYFGTSREASDKVSRAGRYLEGMEVISWSMWSGKRSSGKSAGKFRRRRRKLVAGKIESAPVRGYAYTETYVS
jgi:hypothetical protein